MIDEIGDVDKDDEDEIEDEEVEVEAESKDEDKDEDEIEDEDKVGDNTYKLVSGSTKSVLSLSLAILFTII